MKKITSIILTLFIFASVFSACGTELQNKHEDSVTTSDDSKESLLNNDESSTTWDKITTEDVEFQLVDVTMGTNLNNFPQEDEYLYELPEEHPERNSEKKAYKADEGKGYVVVVYNLKNISNEKLLYKGNTVLRYKNEIYEEYPYSNSRFNIKFEDGFEEFLEYEMNPSDEYEFRVCYEVPCEILENTDESLEVIATFDKEYTFKVR